LALRTQTSRDRTFFVRLYRIFDASAALDLEFLIESAALAQELQNRRHELTVPTAKLMIER
jgi:hypothetical protein